LDHNFEPQLWTVRERQHILLTNQNVSLSWQRFPIVLYAKSLKGVSRHPTNLRPWVVLCCTSLPWRNNLFNILVPSQSNWDAAMCFLCQRHTWQNRCQRTLISCNKVESVICQSSNCTAITIIPQILYLWFDGDDRKVAIGDMIGRMRFCGMHVCHATSLWWQVCYGFHHGHFQYHHYLQVVHIAAVLRNFWQTSQKHKICRYDQRCTWFISKTMHSFDHFSRSCV
jgi:hypothetical protein